LSEKTGPKRDLYSDEIDRRAIGKVVSVAGWIEDARPLGSILFLTVRDGRGVVQAVFDKKALGEEAFEAVKSLPRQSFVIVVGEVRESRSKSLPFELRAVSYSLLSKAIHPLPLDPTGRVDAGLDTRLDNRPLDLRNPRTQAIFKLKSLFLRFAREMLEAEGFMEVHTAKIIGTATEGGAELFAFDYFGRQAYLAQSPQLYKEELTLALDKVYEVGTYFRAERMHTTRHLNEFVSLDVEAALWYRHDMMKLLEKLVAGGIGHLAEKGAAELEVLGVRPEIPVSPFPTLTYSEVIDLIAKKGVDRKFGDDLDADALKVLGAEHPGYYFVVDWPSAIKPFYIQPKPGRPELSESFDLMCGPLELASGGERVADGKLLLSRLLEKGLKPEQFRDHLRAYDWGMPPHSGWGFGVERFVAQLTKRSNIREAVLYPRDSFRITP